MSDTVISALISAAVAIIVCLINSRVQTDKIMAQLDKHNAVQDERIVHLTQQVEKHNTVIERTYKIEQNISVIDEKLSVANHRIADLEAKHE